MIGLCRTPNIVSLDWLDKSAKAGKPLPSHNFLILNDKSAETKYRFSMRRTLEKVKINLESESWLLDGWYVHICKQNGKVPLKNELRLIIEAAGGWWVPSLPTDPMYPSEEVARRMLIIASNSETEKQLAQSTVAAALRKGAQQRTLSWLFHAVMTQEIDLVL